MKISVLTVGASRGVLAPAIREIEERASRYWKLEIVEVDGGVGRGASADEQRVREAEARRLRARLLDRVEVWALTRSGTQRSSETFARTLGARAMEGGRDLAFLIGGAFGLDPSLVDEADHRLSLSEMTLPHLLARLVLAEQLYRAGTILRNEPYHKGSGSKGFGS
jgi:23S rRNA (pseudouridine1915-N3)-methyltransferase